MNPSSSPALFAPRPRFVPALFLTLGLVLAVLPMLTGAAHAAVPTAAFLNPNNDGPGPVVSDQPDGTDSLYHFVVRASDPDGGTITSVAIQIEDGDAGAVFEPIGVATRVGTTDTWELKWMPAPTCPSPTSTTTPAPFAPS